MDTAALSLVTSYLKIQGLPETLETLKKELGSDNVLASPGVAARPEHYVESHARLEEWIACSLERYKAEITGIRFPLFVLCYFKIVELQEPLGSTAGTGSSAAPPLPDLANQFLHQWGGSHALNYPAEMRAISAVKCRQHLGEVEYAKCILGRGENEGRMRYKLRFSRVSSELLHSFILANDLLLLAVLLNDHVEIMIEDRDPLPTMQAVRLLAPRDPLAAVDGDRAPTPELLSWSAFARRIAAAATTAASPFLSSLPSSPSPPPVAEGAHLLKARIAPIPDSAQQEYTFLGAVDGKSAYPSIRGGAVGDESKRDAPDSVTILENLVQSYLLHPSPAYPEGVATSAHTREDPVQLAPALKPSVYFTTFVNAYRGLVSLNVTGDATQLAASFADRVVRVWCLDKQASAMHGDLSQSEDTPLEIKGHSQPVYSLSWSPDQRYLLSGGGDGVVRLSDVKTGRSLVSYQAHAAPVWHVEFCPLGHYFLSGSHDRTARLWATDHVQPLRILVGHLSDVTCTAFHPNCNYAFTGSSDRTARLWELSSGNCLRIFAGHFGSISAVAVCPSGQYFASASEDSSVRIWEVLSSTQIAHLHGHAGSVYSLDYSADGAVIATGGADSTVRIWDVAASFEAATCTGEQQCAVAATHTFRTKNTPATHVRWTRRNLLMAAGSFHF